MSNETLTPTDEDIKAWYDAQRSVNPDADAMGLPGNRLNGETPGNGQESPLPESLEKLEAVADALDTPDHIMVGNRRVTVGSPCLDDLINLFKSLQAETKGNIQEMAAKAEDMAGHVDAKDFSGLLKSAPTARSMFLRCIEIEGGEPFPDEADKWDWFVRRIDAVSAIDILDMFTDRTDWAKLMTKVRRIMGKLQGLATQVRQSTITR